MYADIRGAVRALSRVRHQRDAILRPTRQCDCFDAADSRLVLMVYSELLGKWFQPVAKW